MQSDQTMGIDLPLKALVWQDASRQDMAFIQRSELARQATWNGRGRGTDSQSHGCRIGRRCDDGNEIPLTWRVTKSSAIGPNPDNGRRAYQSTRSKAGF